MEANPGTAEADRFLGYGRTIKLGIVVMLIGYVLLALPTAMNTGFPLTGAHTSINCQSCHVNGNYQLTYTDCYACHKPDFESPTDPNHVAPNWSHDCTTCHTTTAWLPSTFPHDANYFRIWSGRHRGYWTSCYTCHTDPANYAVFTCFNCHTHDKAVTDSHHTSVSGYTYTSSACYSCHRRV